MWLYCVVWTKSPVPIQNWMDYPILAFWFIRKAKDTSKPHTIISLSIYSIIMRNTGIIHIINYSRPQVMRPRYYWRHCSYTSDWAIDIKNPCARRLFIPLIVGINTKNSPFWWYTAKKSKSWRPKISENGYFFWIVFNKEFMPFHMSHT